MFDKISESDKLIIRKMASIAKDDNAAMQLLVMFEDAVDFGDRDILLCKMHRYLEDNEKNG